MTLHLPVIEQKTCNKCGECCRHGGSCTFRGTKSQWKFEGRCEHLVDQPDGTALCSVMVDMAKEAPKLLALFVKGVCDWPQFRKEVT